MTRLLLTTLLAAAVACIAPATAGAAASGYWSDPFGDAIYPHVDIQSAGLTYSDDDYVSIGFGTGVLVGGDRIDIFVDIDNNAATGWYGADVAFYYEKYIQGQWMGTAAWNGAAFQFVTPQTLSYNNAGTSIALSIARAELGAASQINVFARGGHSNVVNAGSSYSDWAPNSGSYSLSLSSVGGVSGPGDSGGADSGAGDEAGSSDGGSVEVVQPTAFLTVAEARTAAARSMKRKLTSAAAVSIARSCTRASSTARRCAATARRSGLVWKGTATITEVVISGQIRYRYAFSGRRYKATCGTRCATTVRWSGLL